MAPKVGVKKVDDDDESTEAQERALAEGAENGGTAKPKPSEDGSKGFTDDEGFVLDATARVLDEKATEEARADLADGKEPKGLKLGRGVEVLDVAVRGEGKAKVVVVVTSDGRKLAKKA
jgi:hypothetical protein